MKTIEVKIDTPYPNAKCVYAFIKDEGEMHNVYLIHPTDQKSQLIKREGRYSTLTDEAKRDLVALRDTLETVFKINGLDWLNTKISEFPNLRKYESSKV